MFLFSDMFYMLVRYVSPSACLKCLMLTLSGPVVFLLCFIYVSVCVVCFMFDGVGEFVDECVSYLCG